MLAVMPRSSSKSSMLVFGRFTWHACIGLCANAACRIEETLSQDVLTKMHAPPKADVPILSDPAQLEEFDGVLFGIPTRYGNFPAQFKTFWDKSGKQWQQGSFWGKYAGVFISTGTMGGGQESTAIASMSTLVHHGFIYVPLGYKTAFGMFRSATLERNQILTNTPTSHARQPRGDPRWLPLGCGNLLRRRRFAPAYCA
jgi:multimeric flavodoxin WrbA